MLEIDETDILSSLGVLENGEESVFDWDSRANDTQTKEHFSGEYFVLKQDLVSSPIVNDLYKMKVSINKKLEGLENEASEDDGYFMSKKMLSELKRSNPDSYSMDIDDDLENEMLKYTTTTEGQSGNANEPIEIDIADDYKPELVDIVVMIRYQSFVVDNNYEFKVPSSIRSSAVLRGSKIGGDVNDEDSLLVTLSSGFLLLIRFYFIDDKIKPYVVQWWKTSFPTKSLPSLDDVGKETLAHSSGSLIALASAQGIIRLHHCSQTSHGVMLDIAQNIYFDGTILHSCFLEPLEDVETEHARIISLMVTSHRRYIIRLFDFWLDQKEITEHSPFMLTNDFDVPVFMFSFKQSAFLMMEKQILIINANHILNADYNFLTAEFNGSFPTNYYKPTTHITSEDDDEVLISTEDGTIYSVKVKNNSVQIIPILKIHRVSNFILEKIEDGYELYYTSSFGNGGYYFLPSLEYDANSYRKSLATGERLEKIDNWAPLTDFEVVDDKYQNQEIWLGHGKALSKIKRGYKAIKELQNSPLRKAYKFYVHAFDEEVYFIFAFVDKTLVFKYEDDQLIDVEDSGLDLLNRTIAVSSMKSICFQVLVNAVVVTDFASDHTIKKEFDEEIILADAMDLYIAVITESINPDGTIYSSLCFYEASGDIHVLGSICRLDVDPHFIKFIVVKDVIYLVVGGPKKLKFFKIGETEAESVIDVDIEFTDPHDIAFMTDHLVISSRFGDVAVYKILSGKEGLKLKNENTFRVCHTPLDLSASANELLLISKSIWKLDLSSRYPVPVVFEELKERTVFNAVILNPSTYAVLREDGFCLVSISGNTRTILKTIKLPEFPKKIKYISHLKLFAIISETSLFFTSKTCKLTTNLYGKRQGQDLFDDEVPISLAEWVLPSADKAFRNLLVGCKTSNGGSIKILQPKYSAIEADVVEAYEIFNYKTDGVVFAFEQLTSDTVIYSSGCDVFIARYNLEQKKMLDPEQVHSFSSVVINIFVRDSTVLISTKQYSFMKFEYKDEKLVPIEYDFSVRKVSNSLSLSDSVTITTDKFHCSITGVEHQENRFRSYVSFMPKLVKCSFKPLWYKGNIYNRFVAYGMGGEVQLYTLLNKPMAQSLLQHYKFASNPTTVTQKGLWETYHEAFVNERNLNVIDAERLPKELPQELQDLLNAVSY